MQTVVCSLMWNESCVHAVFTEHVFVRGSAQVWFVGMFNFLLCTAGVACHVFFLLHIPDFVGSINCVDSIERCMLYVRVVDVEPAPTCVGT